MLDGRNRIAVGAVLERPHHFQLRLVVIVPTGKDLKTVIVGHARRLGLRDVPNLPVKYGNLLRQPVVQLRPLLRLQGRPILRRPLHRQAELRPRIGAIGKVLNVEAGEHIIVDQPQQDNARQNSGPPNLFQFLQKQTHVDTSFLPKRRSDRVVPAPQIARLSPVAMVSCQGTNAFRPSSVNQPLTYSQTLTGWKVSRA